MRPLGLKPAPILELYAALEAPLFHGAARIRQLFRSLWKPYPSRTHIRPLSPKRLACI